MSDSNSNHNSTSRRNQEVWDSLVNPYPPYQPPLGLHHFLEDQYNPNASARATAQRAIPPNPAQRNTSAYSAAIPTTPTAARNIPPRDSPYFPGGIHPEHQARSPPGATTNLPGAYPMGPPLLPLPRPQPQSQTAPNVPIDWTEPSHSGAHATPLPAYSTCNYVPTTPKPKLSIRVPKRGLDVDSDVDTNTNANVSKKNTKNGNSLAGLSESRTLSTSNEEVTKWMIAPEKHREQAREALRIKAEAVRPRDEGRREARRVMVEREEREGRRKVEREKEKEKEELGKGTDVDDVQKGIEELRIGDVDRDKDVVRDKWDDEEMGEEMEEDWEVIEGPKVGLVIVDECVDSDDSDTWY